MKIDDSATCLRLCYSAEIWAQRFPVFPNARTKTKARGTESCLCARSRLVIHAGPPSPELHPVGSGISSGHSDHGCTVKAACGRSIQGRGQEPAHQSGTPGWAHHSSGHYQGDGGVPGRGPPHENRGLTGEIVSMLLPVTIISSEESLKRTTGKGLL